MTKKELKTIEELLFKVYDKGLQQDDCNLTEFANKIEKAINYTCCSMELCGCKKPNSYPKKDPNKFYCTKCGKNI